ncbi:MAG TPA: DUF6531 domain-containing protein [Candidatus Baltobacteraceae bacterium]|nr:DUF6531 domain-containing protein [Candidatus Baltobacteraceae bacterium]
MDSAPANPSASESLTYPTSDQSDSFGWISPANVPYSTSWPAQTYTVTLNVASPNSSLEITAVDIYRVDSNGGPGTSGLALVGSLTGLTRCLCTAKTQVFQVTGSAQTANLTDRIGVKFYVTNTAAASKTFSYLAGQNSGSGLNVPQPYALTADTPTSPATIFNTANGAETGAISQQMDSTPDAQAGETLSYAGGTAGATWGWISASGVPNLTQWPAGAYSITLNVTSVPQPTSNLEITEIEVLRVDQTGANILATVGDHPGLNRALTAAGTYTFSIAGEAQANASPTDRVAVVFFTTNTASTAQSFSYSAGQTSQSGANLFSGPDLGPAVTGINTWWTYEEGTLPGQGKYMVNVGNGNLLVQSTDVDIPERGIDLAFRRTYNSQSQHDSNNTDGSVPSNYGDGWTSTFDAHLSYDGANTISVFDIDGARYDYNGDGSGKWIAPPGQHATLVWDGYCGYQWTKKNGTTYYFYSPDLNETTNCPIISNYNYTQDTAYGGRLYEIIGRNDNNYLSFAYTWANNAPSEIDVTHSDNATQVLKLNFGQQFTGAPTELMKITRPDGKSISYQYDTTTGSTLQYVTLPGNNAGSVVESYGYTSGHALGSTGSPRYNASISDGDVTNFAYDTFNRVTQVADVGLVDFEPSDGTNTYLQPTPSPLPSATPDALENWRTIDFSGYGTGSTTMTDSDGHETVWSVDNLSRVSQTQVFTDESSPTSLITSATWDANNNLVETIDPRGGATDYVYDAEGNVVEMALPAITINSNQVRPTSLYSYATDGNGNLLAPSDLAAYCDPVFTNSSSVNKSWPVGGPTPTPGETPCPTTTAGATRYTWTTTDKSEPYGCLTEMETPAYGGTSTPDPGNKTTISYGATGCGNDGLPSQVTGDAYTQNDNTKRTPTQNFDYDTYGNLACYSKDGGTHWWRLTYDSLNRQTAVADPDDASLTVPQCTNTAGITGSHIVDTTTYYDNGDIASTQTPSEYAANVSTTYTYDADGDQTSKVTHYSCTSTSCTPGTTTNWYDGDDRLVEVRQPQDSTKDVYGFAWLTRYIYDLSQDGFVSITGGASNFHAYGNLYRTQECLAGTSAPINVIKPTLPEVSGPCSFKDIRGNTFDALDRALAKYEVGVGPTAETTNVYDGTGDYGLLSEKLNGVGNNDTLAYDADGNLTNETFGGATPNRTYTYDEDGRVVSLSSTVGTQSRTYDADGHVASASAASTDGTVSYDYYDDGLRKSLSLSIPSKSISLTNLFKYNYFADGTRSSLAVTDGSLAGTFSWTYTAAGREVTESDPDKGDQVPSGGLKPIVYVAKTYTYDAYGRPSQLELPELYTYQSVTYDAEDDVTGDIVQQPNGTNLQQTFPYSTRGELTPSNGSGVSANGVMCSQIPLLDATTGVCNVDTESGAVKSTNYTGTGNSGNGSTTTEITQTYGYDAAGRQTTDKYGSCAILNSNSCTETTVTSTRAYDADNHVTSQTIPATYQPGNPSLFDQPVFTNASTLTQQYTWGPDGHLATFNGTAVETGGANYTSSSDEVWDDDDLLDAVLTSGSYGSGIYIEKLGAIVGGQFLIYDRNLAETSAATHTNSGYSAWNNDVTQWTSTSKQCQKNGIGCGGGTSNYYPPSVALSPQRSDGYSDGVNVFQGVRAYDPNSAQWTAPDAFAGEVEDPMSQKPYMWNDNNPVAYQDPSGYCIGPLLIPCAELLMHAAIDLSIGGQHEKNEPTTILLFKVLPNGATSLPSMLAPNERTLFLPEMPGWTYQQYATRNSSKLREAMHGGYVIKETYVNDDGTLIPTGGLLGLERLILDNAKWKYDPKTRTWNPPDRNTTHKSNSRGSGSSVFYDAGTGQPM